MSENPRLQFGVSIDPAAAKKEEAFKRALLADRLGYDMISIMDHPYNRKLFDTWTLLTALAMKTTRVKLMTNVLNLPLRPPAMLAKAAATLDVLSDGRLEFGLGAGAVWDGVEAFGGPRRSPGEAYRGFKDALHILRAFWDNPDDRLSYDGDIYQVKNAKFGPKPAHRIPIWTGAYGPKMLALTGRMADGVIVSRNYAPPKRLASLNEKIDIGAKEVGRDPADIRRGYNLMGIIELPGEANGRSALGEEYIQGPPSRWVDQLSKWHFDDRMDTYIFWPVGGDAIRQIEVFAQEIVPALRGQVLD